MDNGQWTLDNGHWLLAVAQWLMGLIGPMGLRGLMRPIGPMAIGLLGLILVACTSDPELEPKVTEEGHPVELASFITGYNEYGTRAWLPPTSPTEFTLQAESKQSVGVCFTKDDTNPATADKIGYLFWSSGKWKSSVEITTEDTESDFYLYGYTPHLNAVTCSITDRDGNHARYSEGAILTIENLPSITPADVSVIVGAKNGKDNGYTPSGDYSVTGLQQGKFAFRAGKTPAKGEAATGSNYVHLLFDHLYAGLRLNYKLHVKYDKLRIIEVTKIQLKCYSGETEPLTYLKKKTNITVDLQATADGSSPIQSVTFVSQGKDEEALIAAGEDPYITIYDGEAKRLKTDEDTYFECSFMPKGTTHLCLKTIYNIYDKKGNLIREDAAAENMMPFSELFDKVPSAQQGRRYDVTLTVKPTYLYMLSEPDLENPTVTIE